MPLTVVNGLIGGVATNLRCTNGLISGLGPDVAPQPADVVLDAKGGALVSPMVNGHTHAAMTLFRSFGDDMALMDWLQNRIWPAEARLVDEDVYWGTRLACVEMIRSGTTSFFDMYWFSESVARAVTDSGLRAHVSSVFFDSGDPRRGRDQYARVLEDLDRVSESGPLVEASLGPHAVYTVSRESLEWLGGVAVERGLALHIHCSETESEVEECVDRHGCTPPALLAQVGALTDATLLAHGCSFDDSDIDLVAENGATVVTNPVSNMKLGVGRSAPVTRMLDRGVGLGLGTDGAASNNGLDLFADVKTLALLAKHTGGDPSVLPAQQALSIARGQLSGLLGGKPLDPGQPADFLVVRMDEPETAIGDLNANLVYSASGGIVDSTVVAGRVLMEHREIAGVDEVVARAREAADRVRN